LRGKRIGVEKSFLKIHEKIDALLHDAISAMKNAGASVVEVSYAEKLKDIGDDEYKLLKYEFKDGLNRYLENSGAAVRSLKELIAFNEANASSVMPFFGQEILLESEAMGSLDSEDYKKVRSNVVTTARQAIDGTIKEHNLDALCGPATGAAWCTDVVNGDSFSGYGMGSGAAMAGYPSVTVPFGEVHNLPVGLLFTASAFSERSLLQIAHAYEQVSRKRTPPSLRPSLL
jgi:amidase